MSSCEQLPSTSDAVLPYSSSIQMQEDMSSSTLALLPSSELSSSSPNDVANMATTALHLEQYASELLLWLQQSTSMSLADEALYCFETHYPELVDDLPLLFTWLSLFLVQHEDSLSSEAMLHCSGKMAAVGEQFSLKSTLLPLYWKHESERHQVLEQGVDALETGISSSSSRSRTVFQDEKGLLQWLLQHRQVALTRQDIINHLLEEYPIFAASKSTAALKVWTSRFLKKYIQPQSSIASGSHMLVPEVANDVSPSTTAEMETVKPYQEVSDGIQVESVVSPMPLLLLQPQSAIESQEEMANKNVRTGTTVMRHTGKRQSCSGRYTLFSNEFKLHAVNMLEDGKSVAQVAKELGLKNANCLHYWRSIRDKLVTSERKRFRLAGGGRRSSCTFEDELLTWVSQRHQRGQGTDVKAVLEYMRQYRSAFTEGKKEPTLRKWILRFFKRCWRAPYTSMN